MSGAKVDMLLGERICDATLRFEILSYQAMSKTEHSQHTRDVMAALSELEELRALLADIREAAGDSQGRLMQDELVARITGMATVSQLAQRLIESRDDSECCPAVDWETFDCLQAALAATKPQGSAGNEGGGA